MAGGSGFYRIHRVLSELTCWVVCLAFLSFSPIFFMSVTYRLLDVSWTMQLRSWVILQYNKKGCRRKNEYNFFSLSGNQRKKIVDQKFSFYSEIIRVFLVQESSKACTALSRRNGAAGLRSEPDTLLKLQVSFKAWGLINQLLNWLNKLQLEIKTFTTYS